MLEDKYNSQNIKYYVVVEEFSEKSNPFRNGGAKMLFTGNWNYKNSPHSTS